MTNEELIRLIKQGDYSLMADLYERNRWFIYALVKRSGISPDNYEDAMQDAYFGLHEAVSGYDESMGYKFLTYATHYIRSSIQRGQSASLHISEQVRRAAYKIRRIQNNLTLELNRTPTAAEIGKYAGLDAETVMYILNVNKPVKSIYEPVGEDWLLGDTIADNDIDFENDIAAADERRCIAENVREVLNKLPMNEGEAMRLCYLQGKTDTAAASDLGVTPAQLKQLIEKAKRHLMHPKMSRLLMDKG